MPNQNYGDSLASRNDFFEQEIFSRHASWELTVFGMQNTAPNAHVVLEILSDFYIRVFERWQKIPKEDPAVMRAYLNKMLRHAYIDYYRAKMRGIPTTELTLALEMPAADHTDQTTELLDWCWQIVNTFKSDDQLIFELKYLEGKKEREIAKLTSIPPGTVSVKIKRMLDKLRKEARTQKKAS